MAIKSKQNDQDNEDYQQVSPMKPNKPMGNQPKSYEQYNPTYNPPVSGLQNPNDFEEDLPTEEYDKKQQAILKEGYGNRSGGYNTLDSNTNVKTMPQGVLRNQYSSDREQNKRTVGNANRSEEIQGYQTGQEKLRQGQQRQQEQQRQQQMQGNYERQQQAALDRQQQLAQRAKPMSTPASPQSAQPYSKVVAPPVKGGMGTNTVQGGMGSEKKSSIGKTSVQGGMDSQRKNAMQVTQNPNKKFAS